MLHKLHTTAAWNLIFWQVAQIAQDELCPKPKLVPYFPSLADTKSSQQSRPRRDTFYVSVAAFTLWKIIARIRSGLVNLRTWRGSEQHYKELKNLISCSCIKCSLCFWVMNQPRSLALTEPNKHTHSSVCTNWFHFQQRQGWVCVFTLKDMSGV